MASQTLKDLLHRAQRGEIPLEECFSLAELADAQQAKLEARREARGEAQRRYGRTALGKQRSREQARRLRRRRRQQEVAARALRRCEVCDGPLPLTARRSRRTCSDRCRQKLSRRLGSAASEAVSAEA